MIELVNNQRKFKMDVRLFEAFAVTAVSKIPEAEGKSVTIALVSDRKMREFNKQFRGKYSTTDVLSFPFEPEEFETLTNNLGDIVISVEQAARQADENQLELGQEINQLILHGILHLCGFDHEADDGEMDARELELRKILKI